MKIDLEHVPGELATRLPDVIRVILDAAQADARQHEPLVKSRALDQAEQDFRWPETRAMFALARAKIEARRRVAVRLLGEVLNGAPHP